MTSLQTSNQLVLPESIRERFEQSSGLDFRGGEHIPAKEIWRFLKEDAPVKFPYTFDISPGSSFLTKFSGDIELFSAIKRNYVYLSLRDRLLKAHANGTPVVFVQGYQTMEAYHAAGTIPVGTGFLSYWASNLKDGQSISDFNMTRASFLEAGRKLISPDACHPQISAYGVIQSGVVPVDYIAPYLGVHCSDILDLCVAHRSGKRRVPTFLVDTPLDTLHHHAWDVDYQAKSLRKLTTELGKLAKREVTDEDLRAEIKLENKARKLLQEYVKVWNSAKVPPTGSHDHMATFYGVHRFLPETTAVISMIQGAYDDVKYRAQHGIKGHGVADDPKRIFSCGRHLTPEIVDEAGAVLVGTDVQFGQGSIHVKEEGDPYHNLAEAVLSLPHEMPLEERAHWIVRQVKESRADGVTFMYQWGCNSESAAARIISDIIKEETGLPTQVMEPSDRGTETLEQVRTRTEAFIEILN
jgi:benzoyl-CoA reductase/2-hydroxyglutaryl-CoA dehydratase subunit BcrC/BadD/HgdB